MKRKEIKRRIIGTITDYFETQDIDKNVNENTVLFGENSALDSMGLVNVIVDIEANFLDENHEISLTSEKAMSRRNSPFRTIETLAEFINEQINGNNE